MRRVLHDPYYPCYPYYYHIYSGIFRHTNRALDRPALRLDGEAQNETLRGWGLGLGMDIRRRHCVSRNCSSLNFMLSNVLARLPFSVGPSTQDPLSWFPIPKALPEPLPELHPEPIPIQRRLIELHCYNGRFSLVAPPNWKVLFPLAANLR